MVMSYDEIVEVFEMAKSKGLQLFVGYNRRFDPEIKQMKNKISSGIFHDCATHDIDYVNWILDDLPYSVQVTTLNDDNCANSKRDYNFDYVTITFKYRKG